jgi:hypothetical protein
LEFFIYGLLFSRITLALVFLVAFIGKIRDVREFERTVSSFGIIPQYLVPISARAVLCCELCIIVLLGLGESLLLPGFLLACILLLVFSIALRVTLIRKKKIQCNCFGSSLSPVSSYDLWRNGGFLFCAFVGLALSLSLNGRLTQISASVVLLVGLLAIVFALLSMHLQAIIKLFART